MLNYEELREKTMEYLKNEVDSSDIVEFILKSYEFADKESCEDFCHEIFNLIYSRALKASRELEKEDTNGNVTEMLSRTKASFAIWEKADDMFNSWHHASRKLYRELDF